MQSETPRPTDRVRATAPSRREESPTLVEQAIEAAIDDPGFSDLLYPLVDDGTLNHVHEYRAEADDHSPFVTVTFSDDAGMAPAVCQLAHRAGWMVTDAMPSQRRLTFEPQPDIH